MEKYIYTHMCIFVCHHPPNNILHNKGSIRGILSEVRNKTVTRVFGTTI